METLAYTRKFVICYLTLIFFNFTYHLLVDINVQKLHFSCKIGLRNATLSPCFSKAIVNNVLVVIVNNLFYMYHSNTLY